MPLHFVKKERKKKKNTKERTKYVTPDTELQLVLAVARNLSSATGSKIDPKDAKNMSKRSDFSSSIRTRRESQCLPYAGFF